jgi:hypothetical protein
MSNENIKNMVNALMDNDGIGFKSEFDATMNNIVAEKLADRKTEVANQMINPVVVSETADDDELDEYIQSDGTRRKCKGGDGRRTDKLGNKINKVVTEDEVEEGSKEEYEKFFRAALKKFKVDSPADFKGDDEKKKFFDYIEKNYKGEKSD